MNKVRTQLGRRDRYQAGFTLLEVVVVAISILIIGAIVLFIGR